MRASIGVLAAVGALFGITAGTLWEKRFGISHHPVVSNAVQYLAGLAGILPLAMIFETFSFTWNTEFAAALAYLVIGNSIIAMSLLLAMIRAGEVGRVSSLFFLVPPISALMAWPLLGEAMPPSAGPDLHWRPAAWQLPAARRPSDLQSWARASRLAAGTTRRQQ